MVDVEAAKSECGGCSTDGSTLPRAQLMLCQPPLYEEMGRWAGQPGPYERNGAVDTSMGADKRCSPLHEGITRGPSGKPVPTRATTAGVSYLPCWGLWGGF